MVRRIAERHVCSRILVDQEFDVPDLGSCKEKDQLLRMPDGRFECGTLDLRAHHPERRIDHVRSLHTADFRKRENEGERQRPTGCSIDIRVGVETPLHGA
jgi:hypothetical protein